MRLTKTPIHTFLFFTFIGTSSHSVYAAFAEDVCRNFNGQSICIPPLNPTVDSEWVYKVIAGQWGDVWGTGSSPQQALQNMKDRKGDFIAGPPPPLTCQNCNAVGNGTAYGPLLGESGSSIYDSSSNVYSFANFMGYLAYTQKIPITSSKGGWYGGVNVFGSRNVTSFRCPANTKAVNAKNLDIVKYPFMCELPPQPKRCEVGKPNNPISPTCGNPIDYVSGNKIQHEVDWSSSSSPLKITRTYNSFPENEFITGKKFNPNTNWDFNFDKQIRLQFNHFDVSLNKLEESYIGSADFLFTNFEWHTSPRVFYPIVRLKRPGGNTLIAYVKETVKLADGTIEKVIFTLDQKQPNIRIEAFRDGSWLYLDENLGITEIYNNQGAIAEVNYKNGQFLKFSYQDIILNDNTVKIGMLSQITDHFNQTLTLNYNKNGQISSIQLPNTKLISYQYDEHNNLVRVNRAGYGEKIYHYGETRFAPSGHVGLLTGITDEKGIRFATYQYDAQNRAISTEHANQADKYQVTYTPLTVTTPTNASISYRVKLVQGYNVPEQMTGIAGKNTQVIFDNNGNVISANKNGQTTKYTYDLSRNLEISRTEAVGTAQERVIETAWHTDFSKPVQIRESASGRVAKITDYSYDDRSNVISTTITDPVTQQSRTWRYDYNPHSQLTKETNPLGQTTTYAYDPNRGYLLSQTDFTGAVSTFSQHTLDGLPQLITHPTGMVVRLSYDDAGRIIQQKQESNGTQLTTQASSSSSSQLSWWQKLLNALFKALGLSAPYAEPKPTNHTPQATISVTNTIQTAITTYEYDPRGLLISTTLPDGEKIEYSYDDAHRLVEIKDQSGNRTVYTLNANGDITQTEVYGTSGQLEAKNQQIYDNLGRLQATLGNAQQQQNYTYNQKDELIHEKNALNAQNSYSYDALGRQITETDSLNGVSRYEYDALDQLKKVIDAKGGITTYQYNAFGEKVAQQSPDTGATSYQYQNGQLLEKVDANQRKHQYQYDAQGRVILQKDQYADGSDRYEQTSFAYGTTGNNLGKLTSANNKRAETQFNYNSLGLVTEKSVKYLTTHQTTAPQLKTHYAYSTGGKLKQMGLPSGNIVNYDYNATGQLTGIRFNDQSFINNIQYSANGVKAWTYSQAGDTVQMQYDLDGRISKIQMPNVYDKNYSYDAADRILTINDSQQSAFNSAFKHDALNRLIEQNTLNQTLKYSYDKNSNRLSRQTIQGTTTTTENYTLAPDSNRLTAIQQGTATKNYQYLATGQITSDGIRNYTYDAQGRSETISQGNQSVFNAYDAFGQRIQKFSTVAGTTTQTLFMYDENGQLLGEYTPEGQVIREYIWLGSTLVGLRSHQYPNEILRVHSDHLGTPRAISNNTNQVVWRWEGDQFGDVLPTGNLTFPIRHAGQYYDAEVNIFYNYFRDYDPITGRYVESDPIGLDGGLNTYGYVGGDALRAVDPRGEFAMALPAVCAGGGCAAAASAIINTIRIIAIWERPWRKRDTWLVYTRCHVKKSEECENCPPTIGGKGFGSTFGNAFANAQHDANENLSLNAAKGCQKRHCQPIACFKNSQRINCPMSGR